MWSKNGYLVWSKQKATETKKKELKLWNLSREKLPNIYLIYIKLYRNSYYSICCCLAPKSQIKQKTHSSISCHVILMELLRFGSEKSCPSHENKFYIICVQILITCWRSIYDARSCQQGDFSIDVIKICYQTLATLTIL